MCPHPNGRFIPLPFEQLKRGFAKSQTYANSPSQGGGGCPWQGPNIALWAVVAPGMSHVTRSEPLETPSIPKSRWAWLASSESGCKQQGRNFRFAASKLIASGWRCAWRSQPPAKRRRSSPGKERLHTEWLPRVEHSTCKYIHACAVCVSERFLSSCVSMRLSCILHAQGEVQLISPCLYLIETKEHAVEACIRGWPISEC